MLDHARDRAIPSQTGRGHIEVPLDSPASEKMVFLLMPWKLGLDHMLMTMLRMLTSMRLDFLYRSTVTNTKQRKINSNDFVGFGN